MAARKAPLRVVEDGEAPKQVKPPRTVKEAAESGSRRDLLVTMRARVALSIDDPNTPARDLAALTRRMSEFAREIEAIDLSDIEEGATSGASPDEEWTAI